MAIERLLTGNLGSQVKELMATEDILLEAVRDLVKDEIKTYIRQKVDADEELKEELKEAISYYFNAKARSVYAELKLAVLLRDLAYAFFLMNYKVKLERLWSVYSRRNSVTC